MEYTKGTEITQNGETFTLLEKMVETYPTNKPDALVRWRVGVKDRNGEVDEKSDFYRAVREVGTPNTNIPETIIGVDFYTKVKESSVLDEIGLTTNDVAKAAKKLSKVVVKTSNKRGRPAIAMNNLKSKNIIRNFKQGLIKSDDSDVIEAFNFLMNAGEEVYLEKHFIPYI